MPQPGAISDDVLLTVNQQAVIEDFEIVGRGLVKRIVRRAEDSVGTS